MVAGYGEIAKIKKFPGCGGPAIIDIKHHHLRDRFDLAALSEAGFEPVTVGYELGESGLTRRET
jgi:hypothetical protein